MYYEVWLKDVLGNWCSPLNNRFSTFKEAIYRAKEMFTRRHYTHWEVRRFVAAVVVARGER